MSQDTNHFQQKKQRSVELIKPSPALKGKVGSGGLDDKILQKAEALIQSNTVDFLPQGMRYLTAIQEGLKLIQTQKHKHEMDSLVAVLVNPAMQLKANGAMFGYPLVTKISTLMLSFLEVIKDFDQDCMELMNGFVTALNAVFVGNIRDGNQAGEDLYQAIQEACERYFEKAGTTR